MQALGAWAATAIEMGRLACAERSIERSERSESYGHMSCRRRFKGRRACAERDIERSKQGESRKRSKRCRCKSAACVH